MVYLVFKCTECVSVPGTDVFDKMECVYTCVHHCFWVNSGSSFLLTSIQGYLPCIGLW